MLNAALKTVDPRTLKTWLHDGQEIALLDVREAGQFGERHLFLAIPVPYSRLELDVRRLVPRLGTRVVLVDDHGTDVASRAAQRLIVLGYTNVHVLLGGVNAWSETGFEVFAGVNVPSKAFGELAEHHFGTPHISAKELAAKFENAEKVVVLDGRPVPEFKKMSIPNATCCPNGELALRVDDLVKDEDTPIVINCAGRTRSIIGAQTLINLGVSNPVYALENGTQGWYLNDLQLDHGADRVFPDLGQGVDLGRRVERAKALADRYGIQRISLETLRSWLQDESRTTYLCDVRTPEESRKQPIAHAQSTPGGQLIQATDQYVATRGARLVLTDTEDVRAPVVATWMYMLGWDVYVLPASESAQLLKKSADDHAYAIQAICTTIDAMQVADHQSRGVPILDLRPGMQYRKGHVKGAYWSIRPILGSTLETLGVKPREVVLLCQDRSVAELAAIDLKELGVDSIYCYEQDIKSLEAAGLEIEVTPNSPSNEQCIDYLFFVHDRHDGNKQASRQYLAWETNLISQLDEQEKAMFRFDPQP